MKNLTLFMIIVVALVVGWYTWTPIRAVNQLETAIHDGDQARLERLIDFESVRSNLKTDARSLMGTRARNSDNPLASLGATLGGALTDGVVDAIVTPRGLASLLRGNGRPQESGGRYDDDDDFDFNVDRVNPLRFDARAQNDEGDDLGPVLDFRLRGIRWKVVRIEMRDRATREASQH